MRRTLCPRFSSPSMWLWSGEHGDGNDFVLISAIASALARYDPDLARVLVEPCFDEVSWLYDETHHYRTYWKCGPVQAALRIDPDWAAGIVREICAAGLADSDMHRTELVFGAVDELRTMIMDLNQ